MGASCRPSTVITERGKQDPGTASGGVVRFKSQGGDVPHSCYRPDRACAARTPNSNKHTGTQCCCCTAGHGLLLADGTLIWAHDMRTPSGPRCAAADRCHRCSSAPVTSIRWPLVIAVSLHPLNETLTWLHVRAPSLGQAAAWRPLPCLGCDWGTPRQPPRPAALLKTMPC